MAIPSIAITMGDPAGIGPEVVLKALNDEAVRAACLPVVFGDTAALESAARQLDVTVDWKVVDDPKALTGTGEGARVVDLGGVPEGLLFGGRATEAGGQASLRYIHEATSAVQAGHAQALVTAPANKQALGLAGCTAAGHTDLLAERFGVEHPVMMLVGGPLRVALVTHHVALRDVDRQITCEGIVRTARTTAKELARHFHIAGPRLAVCGLNPHAGDAGRFGDEEGRVIGPALSVLRDEGIEAVGPLPPDTCFLRASRGEFDAVIAMYHDQGLIPLKLLAFEEGVNVTLGLPIIRTSPDHGTAYDIAGEGVAAPRSMVAAILLAARMCSRRERTSEGAGQ
jgi:4-hydroxythreonine-4-phosphate dehydrogenase